MDALEAVLTCRELLRDLTPLKTDCGRVCGAACCRADEDGRGGMLLFPGEEACYARLPDGFSIQRDDAVLPGMRLLLCNGVCDRAFRPLSCRIFPMLPSPNGAKMDRRAWAVCPLMACGRRGLNPEFVEKIRQAGRILYACPEHAAFLDALHAFNEKLKSF